MIARHAVGQSSMKRQMESSTVSLPRSCRINTAVAVNALVSEPMRYTVPMEFGTPSSSFASP